MKTAISIGVRVEGQVFPVSNPGWMLRDWGLLPVVAFIMHFGTTALGWQVTGLFNTGVDHTGQVLPATSPDPHYTVTFVGSAGPAYVRPVVYHFGLLTWQAWATPPAGSAWVGPTATESIYPYDDPGYYVYCLRWWLDPGDADVSAFRLRGLWASDNDSWIYLNGSYTGHARSLWGFEHLLPFEVGGLRPGVNELCFHVANEWGPTGLLVSGLHVVGPVHARVPETGLTLLWLVGACAVLRWWGQRSVVQ
ncbi:MAG: hypothetical protein RMN51_09385 [Verrucomicrobiota bacterium]|nr:hypothetical protein [Limisphaera sp.]MDW8382304.1 hypothetical protein [Verrucomicrobiota bacterium]